MKEFTYTQRGAKDALAFQMLRFMRESKQRVSRENAKKRVHRRVSIHAHSLRKETQ